MNPVHPEAARLSVMIDQALLDGRLDRVGGHEVVDDVVAGCGPDGHDREPHDHEPDRDRSQLEPAPAACEPDGRGPGQDREHPDPVGDDLEELGESCASPSWSDSMIVMRAFSAGICAARSSTNW